MAIKTVVENIAEVPMEGWLRAAAAFLLCVLIIRLLIPPALRTGLVDRPGGRKDHACPIPVVGGLGIALALALSALMAREVVGFPAMIFLASAFLLVLIGLLDDLYDLRWYWRIGAQAAAALAMVFLAGIEAQNMQDILGLKGVSLGAFAIPFTVFVVVGVINAVNMADGVDGLAGTLVLVSLGQFVCFALYAGDVEHAQRMLLVLGAVAGFLFWNLRLPWQPRARVFLGNGGSMLLGFAIAWVAVRGSHNPVHPVSPVLGPWTIALPLIDCVTLMFRRVMRGRSPFSADRHHMHHLLLDAGFRPGQVVALLGGLSLLLGIAAAFAIRLDVHRPLLVLVFLALLAGWYWFSRDFDRAVARLARLRRGPALASATAAGEGGQGGAGA